MEAKEKVSFIHSITAKIMLMVVVMVALSLMACISIANVRASATVNNVNENFILSLTESAAKTLDKISIGRRHTLHAHILHDSCTLGGKIYLCRNLVQCFCS